MTKLGTPEELAALLNRYNACKEAKDWAKDYQTLAEAWEACPRGDWMLWLAARAELCTQQELVLAACACARLALTDVRKGEMRPLVAIETTERWARDEDGVTLKDVRKAAAASYAASAYVASATYAAADAADAVSAAYAAYAASYAASYTAYAASYAASYAVDAAYAAADAAAAAIQTKTLATCAAIVRTHSRTWTK